jgi:predicted metal-binding membrane protein
MSILKSIISIAKNYSPIVHQNARVGTKIAWTWLVFSGILITWLLVGVPILAVFYPQLMQYAQYTSNIIIALIGGASVVYTTNETRKTVEFKKSTTVSNETDDKIDG